MTSGDQPPGGYPPPPPPGQPWPPGYPPPPGYGYYGRPPGTNGFAIAALICAFLCAPLGLVFGIMARNQIRQTGQDGDGLALAGIIVSAVSLALFVVWILLAIVVFSSAGSGNVVTP